MCHPYLYFISDIICRTNIYKQYIQQQSLRRDGDYCPSFLCFSPLNLRFPISYELAYCLRLPKTNDYMKR